MAVNIGKVVKKTNKSISVKRENMALTVEYTPRKLSEAFVKFFLSKLRNDDIGCICCTDENILLSDPNYL